MVARVKKCLTDDSFIAVVSACISGKGYLVSIRVKLCTGRKLKCIGFWSANTFMFLDFPNGYK